MYSTLTEEALHGYSVIRICLNDRGDRTVPVGVVAWDTPSAWQGWRWLADGERISGVSRTDRKLMQIARSQIRRWADAGEVPYESSRVYPASSGFWRAVSNILTTAVRLDAPRAMAPMVDPDAEIESLFESIVQPAQPLKRRVQRIDSAIRGALGELADRIPSEIVVSAFGQTEETVRWGLETGRGMLLVDGINLAAATARQDADAFVSRFLRINAADRNRPVELIVGYVSSPGGLNGEACMCDWIREQLTDKVFDLVAQNDAFQRSAAEAWAGLAGDLQIDIESVGTTRKLPTA